ncbi:MAG: hypothetical protein AAF035_14480, partial [Pseudomonadota bacterium]
MGVWVMMVIMRMIGGMIMIVTMPVLMIVRGMAVQRRPRQVVLFAKRFVAARCIAIAITGGNFPAHPLYLPRGSDGFPVPAQ